MSETAEDTSITLQGASVEAATVVVDGITPEAAEQLRAHVEAASGGGNRFLWFSFGFVAALVAGVVAAVVFLVASDDDDDGRIDLEVPTVDVSVEP